MTHNLEIFTDVEVDKETLSAIKIAVITTLTYLSIPAVSLSLLMTDDERLQQLNLDFRHIDSTTDVLSFPANEAFPDLAEQQIYLGDVAISVPYAQKQAQLSDHSLVAELQLLAIHGVLHLLGYDHLEQEEKDEMWLLQRQILSKLGLHDIAPTET